jgi:hypothetical protein
MNIIKIIYIYIHYSLNKLIGLRIRGLGYVQRFLTKPFIINAFDKKMFYTPDVEGSYDYLMIGKSNEPETHLFLNKMCPKNHPLVIFVYNNKSKKHFKLKDIQALLGDPYSIYSLKGDGSLDQDFSNSWNCVAVPRATRFEEIITSKAF